MEKLKTPFINWEALAQLAMSQRREQENRPRPRTGYGAWDDNAAFYDQMAKMEAIFTLNQINCFDTDPSDTVLDVGCGPGRIAVPMARRAKSVTAMDSSSKMLGYCLKNAEEAGLTNVVGKYLDFHEAELEKPGTARYSYMFTFRRVQRYHEIINICAQICCFGKLV